MTQRPASPTAVLGGARHGGCRMAPASVRTSRTLTAAGDLLRALAAPVRIAIVLRLREAPCCVHDLVDALELSQPLVSQHLRVLKEAGVVGGERRGREVVYSLADDHLAHIVLDAVAHAEESVSWSAPWRIAGPASDGEAGR